jgi:hypothetical protein
LKVPRWRGNFTGSGVRLEQGDSRAKESSWGM